MKKNLKKMLSFIFAIILVLGIVPIAEFNAEAYVSNNDFDFEVRDGQAVVTAYTGEGTDVIIPDTFAGFPVTAIESFAFSQKKEIKNVVIPEGIEYIYHSAFENCSSLTSVSLPQSLKAIYLYAFAGCSLLKSIAIPSGVEYIGKDVFMDSGISENKSNLENGVLYIGDVLVSADFSLKGKYSIKNGTRLVASSAFDHCFDLTEVIIPDSVRFINNEAFNCCSSLKKVTLSKNIEKISKNTFYDCIALSSINIPDSVAAIEDYAFSDCSSLKSAVIPEGVKSIGKCAFADCSNLSSISLPDSLENISEIAFYHSKYYNTRTNWNNNVLYIGNCLIEANANLKGDYSIKSGTKLVAVGAFSDCDKLTSLSIPASVKIYHCSAFNLKKINVDNGNPFYSSDSNGVLYNKDKTVLIEYPFGKEEKSYKVSDGVKKIGDFVFSRNDNLTEVILPDSVEELGESAFYQCLSLNEIKLPKNLKKIGSSCFDNCYSIKEIVLPDSVRKIGESAFEYCYALESINIPHGVEDIAANTFNECDSLKQIIIPDSVKYLEEEAFKYCTELNKVTLGSGLRHIGSRAFDSCISLKEINIPESVISIQSMAFDDSFRLKEIIINNPDCHICQDEFTLPANTVIFGNKNSTAQSYAESYKRQFKEICPTNHKNTTEFSAQSATCAECGYTAGVFCSDCGEWISGHEKVFVDHTDKNNDKKCDVCGKWVNDIDVDKTVTVEFEEEEMKNFRFTPESSGVYLFSGETLGVTLAYLYDENMNFIMSSEYSYSGFTLPCQLEAGKTYYIGIKAVYTWYVSDIDITLNYYGEFENVYTDSSSKITVAYPDDAFDETVEFNIEKDDSGYDYLPEKYGRHEGWKITATQNGAECLPDGFVIIKIPVPENFDKKTLTAYFINTVSEYSGTEISEVKDGYIVIYTSDLGLFQIVDDSTGSSNCTCGCHGVLFAKLVFRIKLFFWKIFRIEKHRICDCGEYHW